MLRNESEIRTSGAVYVRFQRINAHSKSLFRDVRIRNNVTNRTRLLHVMDQTLITYFISYVLLKESPFRTRLDQLLGWIDQAGKITFFYNFIIRLVAIQLDSFKLPMSTLYTHTHTS